MKTLSVALLFLLTAPAAQGQEFRRSLVQFCTAIASINRQGLSAAPGTMASQLILSKTTQTQADYRTVWSFARLSDVTSCRGIW
jgi:hypothetical protein